MGQAKLRTEGDPAGLRPTLPPGPGLLLVAALLAILVLVS